MRISTQSVYDRGAASLSSLSTEAQRLQTQISTGKRIAAPSDDAAAWRQLVGIKRATANEEADAANITLATNLLAASDDAMSAIADRLVRARELATQAATGTLSDGQKAVIATELEAMVEDLLKLANTTDVRGQPLFGGATGDVAYTQAPDGTISYASTGEPPAIPIGDGASVQATTRGDRAFGSMFSVIQGLAAAIRTGGSTSTAASQAALDSLKTAIDGVADARASVGARASRLELETQRLEESGLNREATRAALEDTDVATAITQLQKTLTVLQATQASFTKLTSLSLFDYLR
jgi:flagellar hook-associated protein 3 FlgL